MTINLIYTKFKIDCSFKAHGTQFRNSKYRFHPKISRSDIATQISSREQLLRPFPSQMKPRRDKSRRKRRALLAASAVCVTGIANAETVTKTPAVADSEISTNRNKNTHTHTHTHVQSNVRSLVEKEIRSVSSIPESIALNPSVATSSVEMDETLEVLPVVFFFFFVEFPVENKFGFKPFQFSRVCVCDSCSALKIISNKKDRLHIRSRANPECGPGVDAHGARRYSEDGIFSVNKLHFFN